ESPAFNRPITFDADDPTFLAAPTPLPSSAQSQTPLARFRAERAGDEPLLVST
ncbi:hypothetical protein C0993_005378, partial [Termitomyces sp. T159_Od127]